MTSCKHTRFDHTIWRHGLCALKQKDKAISAFRLPGHCQGSDSTRRAEKRLKELGASKSATNLTMDPQSRTSKESPMTQIPHLTGQIADYDIIVVAICAGTAILARAR